MISVIVVIIGKCFKFKILKVWLFNYWVVFVFKRMLFSEIFILNMIIVFYGILFLICFYVMILIFGINIIFKVIIVMDVELIGCNIFLVD